MTQIQLEHTRKLTFVPESNSSGLMMPPAVEGDFGMVVGKELPGNHKPLPPIQFKKYALGSWSVKCICVPVVPHAACMGDYN